MEMIDVVISVGVCSGTTSAGGRALVPYDSQHDKA